MSNFHIFYNKEPKSLRISKLISIREDYFQDAQENKFDCCIDIKNNYPELIKVNKQDLEFNKIYIFKNKNNYSLRISRFKQIATGKPKTGLIKDMQGKYHEEAFLVPEWLEIIFNNVVL